MAFSRAPASTRPLEGDALTSAMVGIGFLFAADPHRDANIEDALVGASVACMDEDDLRTLAVLTTWLHLHHPRVNADRLVRAVTAIDSARPRAFWSAVGSWLAGDRRFARLVGLHTGTPLPLLRVGNDFQLQRRGEDERFHATALRVPAGVLRDRPQDVMSVQQLARFHAAYRERLRLGPSYRADMWAALQRRPELTPSELARATYGSFATAWQTKRDFDLYAKASPRAQP